MERNWKLDKNESLNWKGRTLYRVVLTKDCEHGKAGDKMGWIEKEENLQDDAMVFDEAKIYDNAKVYDDAILFGNVHVYDTAQVCGDAKICDKTIITNDNIPTTPPTEQVGGNHYSKMKIEPIKFILANDIPFCEANVIKYICRYKEKNGIEDLLKAKQYIDFLINELKECQEKKE